MAESVVGVEARSARSLVGDELTLCEGRGRLTTWSAPGRSGRRDGTRASVGGRV
jgi:hypothetical protein